jgi:exodeoxyribonuclease VII large subunit
MFRPDASMLKMNPKDGMQVIVKGEINVYPQSGRYQVLVRDMRPVGVGELLLKLEELKIKLNKKGWFRAEHKKPIPKFPRRIGVVTSPTGAAIQDMLHVLTRRFSGFQLLLNPVRVQGDGSAQEIARAIGEFNKYDLVDVMIIGRGGGSIEDLWAFNEEIVAEAIFNSRIPIISAVGHETDHCIADYVADVRAPTPSAAAELVITEKQQQLNHLAQIQRRLEHSILQLIRHDRQRLIGVTRQPVLASTYALLGPWVQKTDFLRQTLDDGFAQRLATYRIRLDSKQLQLSSLSPTAKLAHSRQRLKSLDKALATAVQQKLQTCRIPLENSRETLNYIWQQTQGNRLAQLQPDLKRKQLMKAWMHIFEQKRERLINIKNTLDTLNPKNLLTKGYCILFSENDRSAITSVHSVAEHQNLLIVLADGQLSATANKQINYPRKEQCKTVNKT